MNRNRFQPRVESLEGRLTPSSAASVLNAHAASAVAATQAADSPTAQLAAQPVPFKETLTLVSVSSTGAAYYEGTATHLGRVSAVLYPDNSFVKTAANGDTLVGQVTHVTATTGTIAFTGGTGRFAGATGSESYVISAGAGGAVTVDVAGSITYGAGGQDASDRATQAASTQVTNFRWTGSGTAPDGVALFPGGTVPHDATGTASHLGRYSSTEGQFTLLTVDYGSLTGTFTGTFVFISPNGDRLTLAYGASDPGQVTLTPNADGTFTAVFVAEFTPTGGTGRFERVTGGSFTVTAVSEPFTINFATGYTSPFGYTWSGTGTLEFSTGRP